MLDSESLGCVSHGTRTLAHVVGFCFSGSSWLIVSHCFSKLGEAFKDLNFMVMQVP